MFTGIIEEIGRVRRVYKQGESMKLTVGATKVTEDVRLGDSIAVNGVCLTVVAFDSASFTADVMPETFRQTNLRHLSAGDRVNLERAMALNGRFGGHIVQGHVDTTARVVSRRAEQNAVVFRLEPADAGVMKYIVPRGSIALDGISLTVVEAGDRTFTVSIIPHTLEQTILQDRQPGDTVNVECDLLGKYVERLLAFGVIPSETDVSAVGPFMAGNRRAAPGPGRNGITEQFLAEHGFG